MNQDTFRTDHPSNPAGEPPVVRRYTNRGPEESGIDSDLVEKTRAQIRNLVQEIADLAKSDLSPAEFYEGFLVRTTSALASAGGVMWIRESADRPFELKYQINLSATSLAEPGEKREQHARLLHRIAQRNEPALIPPHSGGDDDNSAVNPTEFLLIIGPLFVDGELVGLVEIFQRTGAGPAAQRGYLRFLTQMCEVAGDYLKNQRLRSYSRQQQTWQTIEQFSRRIHQQLDPERTAFAIANEGRRLLDCDRVSVAILDGRIARIVSVSGLDTIERRADQVKSLSRLVSSVLRAGQPVWYEGDSSGLAPQIEDVVQQYIDKSHSRMIAVLPLIASEETGDSSALAEKKRVTPARPERIIGALVIENLGTSKTGTGFRERANMVVSHSSLALGNSIEHDSIFLMPLWKSLSWISRPFARSRLPKTMLAISAVACAGFLMLIVPWPFTLGSQGQLVAEKQQDIFARLPGVVNEINEPEDPDAIIEQGTILATMIFNDLAIEVATVEGQLLESKKRVSTLARAMNNENDPQRKMLLSADVEREQYSSFSLENQLRELRKKEQDLVVRAPITGKIADWQLRRNLQNRPVVIGQKLMTIVAPDTAWQVELYVPEKRVGHLLTRVNENPDPVQVSFTLASRPGHQFWGQVISIDKVMDVYDDQGNAARVLVEFDDQTLDNELRRSGTRVTARLHCGIRPVGYVLFRELIETAQSTWNFWF